MLLLGNSFHAGERGRETLGGGDIGVVEWGKCRKYMLQCIGEWKVQKGGIVGNIPLNTHITYFFTSFIGYDLTFLLQVQLTLSYSSQGSSAPAVFRCHKLKIVFN
jgi:hypothetical protein